jgi:hypothetical protein
MDGGEEDERRILASESTYIPSLRWATRFEGSGARGIGSLSSVSLSHALRTCGRPSPREKRRSSERVMTSGMNMSNMPIYSKQTFTSQTLDVTSFRIHIISRTSLSKT